MIDTAGNTLAILNPKPLPGLDADGAHPNKMASVSLSAGLQHVWTVYSYATLSPCTLCVPLYYSTLQYS